MTKTPILIALAAVAAAGLVALFGGVLDDSHSAAPPLVTPQAVEDYKAGFALGDATPRLVADLQATLRLNPSDEHSWLLLGLAYQQRARETGDPSYYPKSEGALRRALALDSSDALAYSGLGSLALSRHRFREALALGERARRLSPYTARNDGVIGDALVELGRYREAFAAFDEMDRLRPSLASYARISYARELLGHYSQAVRAMRLAIDAAAGEAEPLAWTHVQLGKLAFNHGHYTEAARAERLALDVFPGYPYGLDALAQAEAALGHYRRAIALEREAVDAIPLPQYVAFLGDLYRATGRPALARRQYALIGAIERLLAANGVETDLEIAQFEVDHGLRLRQALARARVAQRERPSIDGDDVLAWALARDGRCGEALRYSKRALRLSTLDATKFFHRGMIERCLGHPEQARRWFRRALALNPRFSLLWAPVAARYAR